MSSATALLNAIQHELQHPVRERQPQQSTGPGHAAAVGGCRSAALCNLVRSCCRPLLSAALGRCRKMLMAEEEPTTRLTHAGAGPRIDGCELVGALYVAGGAAGALLAAAQVEMQPCPHLSAQVSSLLLCCSKQGVNCGALSKACAISDGRFG